MQMAANAGGTGAPVPFGGTNPEMSEEMRMQMAANGGATASIPGGAPGSLALSPEMENMSLGGPGGPGASGFGTPAGNQGGGITGKPDPAFEAELAEITAADHDLKLPELAKLVQPSVVQIKTRGVNGSGAGTGFIVSKSGLVLTSYLVIEGAKQATVEFSDGTKTDVTGFRLVDPFYGIALLQIKAPGKGLKPLALVDALPGRGEAIVSFSASQNSQSSALQGKISEVFDQNQMQAQVGIGMRGTWLQSSVPISPEASGSPLVNSRGQVIAMNTLQSAFGKDLNYAVSSQDLLAFAKAGSGKKVEKLDPKRVPLVDKSLKRLAAKDIQGSDRANELLAKIPRIHIQLVYDQAKLDPKSLLKNGFLAYAKRNIEKLDIPVSAEAPKGNDPVMVVTLRSKPSRKTDPDRQTMFANAFLIMKDPESGTADRFVKVWSVTDYELGTVSVRGLSQGFIPKSFPPKVSSFYNKFKTGYSKAGRLLKTKKG